MNRKSNPGLRAADQAARLRAQLHAFLEQLGVQGYALAAIREYERTIGRLCREVESHALDVEGLAEPAIENLRTAVVSKASGAVGPTRDSAWGRFTG